MYLTSSSHLPSNFTRQFCIKTHINLHIRAHVEVKKERILIEMEEELQDMDMAAAAEQLMQLSGDEDDDSKNDSIVSSSSTQTHNDNINKRKNHENVVAAQNRGDQSFTNYQISDSLITRPKKRRRYRSIMHLYMSTKPVLLNVG